MSTETERLRTFGTFTGVAGAVREIKGAGRAFYAASFVPKQVVSLPEGMKLTAKGKRELITKLAASRPEFTGGLEWMPDAEGEVTARLELRKITKPTGDTYKVQAVIPRDGLGESQAQDLLNFGV